MTTRRLLPLLLALLLVSSGAGATTTTTSTSSTTSTTLLLSAQAGVLVTAQAVTGTTGVILCVDRLHPASVMFLIDAGATTSTVIEHSMNKTLWVPVAAALTADGEVTVQNPAGCYRGSSTISSGTVTIDYVASTRP